MRKNQTPLSQKTELNIGEIKAQNITIGRKESNFDLIKAKTRKIERDKRREGRREKVRKEGPLIEAKQISDEIIVKRRIHLSYRKQDLRNVESFKRDDNIGKKNENFRLKKSNDAKEIKNGGKQYSAI